MDTIETDGFIIRTRDQLDGVYGDIVPGAALKETDFITPPGRAIIEASPFLILATASADGIDCSPKGDAPGFVQIADEKTLLIPDRPGNNRIDGMKNIIDNPKVGIIFMVPGVNETYRVNGAGHISVDPDLLARFEVRGKPPRAVMVIKVEQAFYHCPKAFVRSGLWAAGAEGRPEGLPTGGTFAAYRESEDDAFAKKYDEEYAVRMPKQLY
jgi:PPOX class probable FMN-dependent enzyme